VQADYVADYCALTGNDPPRPLYSRALKMRREKRRSTGTSLLPPVSSDADRA
jgi:hypothetical protein